MTINSLKLADRKVIVLIGMMGVGKTTIGSKLSEKLGIYFIDSDQEIEDSEQKVISDIFEESGEDYFRKIEKKTIADVFARDEPVVLSLGGGSLTDPETAALIEQNAISIWLSADIETILHRIAGKDNRPLLKNKDKRTELESLMKKRELSYRKANIKIDTDQENRNGIIDSIFNKINDLVNG